MLNKLNLYILKKFFYIFLLTFLVFAVILFIGDFVEQFRKSTGKNIAVNIIFQLTLFNFLSLVYFTLPLTVFTASIITFLSLIRGSEKIIINSVGISNFKIALPIMILYVCLGIFFITIINPLTALLDEKYSELEYKYIDRVDKFASITKNGLWLKQENDENGFSSVLYAKRIKQQGTNIYDFMILEYDNNGSFQGRLDGEYAVLYDGFWKMNNTQITPKFGSAKFEQNYVYKTNIKPEDITDSLSSPSNISIWRLVTFINFLEGLGYSAVDFKLHFYDLVFLPLFMASLALLASSLVKNLNQNDKFTNIIIFALIIIFFIYFASTSKCTWFNISIKSYCIKRFNALIITFMSILIYQSEKLKSYTNHD